MTLNPQELANYIEIKYNVYGDKSKLIELLENYNDAFDPNQTKIINKMFESLYGMSIELLNKLALQYNGTQCVSSSINTSLKELTDVINELSSKIDILTKDNEELRSNYWRLNQSIIKSRP